MNIQNMHNGLHRVPLFEAAKLMPEIAEVLFSLKPERSLSEYTIDVKVHMLMPKQYPCIPNWHYDMVPRVDGKQDFSKINDELMYLWLSGPPLTQFKYGLIPAKKWVAFTQRDLHKGTQASEHGWRLFIRACPITILSPNPPEKWIRRHSQVYLNAENFNW